MGIGEYYSDNSIATEFMIIITVVRDVIKSKLEYMNTNYIYEPNFVYLFL